MSDDELKNELERLRNENAALKKGAATGITMKVSEKGWALGLWNGAFPGDLVQGAVAQAPGYVRRYPGVYRGERGDVEDEGVSARWALVVLGRDAYA